MSRTYRRKYGDQSEKEFYTSDWVRIDGSWRSERIPLNPNSKEYKVGLSKFHGDHGTHNFKEPGPSWFRNLYAQRPHRRSAKNELRKFLTNSEYEPIIDDMPYLPYWT